MKNLFTILFLAAFTGISTGYTQPLSPFWNEAMQKIAMPNSQPDWINFRDDIIIDPATIFTTHKTAFALGQEDEMRIYKTEKDNLGFTHYRYNQYYKGYRIICAEYFVHAKNNNSISANGKMLKGLTKNPVVSLTKDVALQLAKNYLPSLKYAWEIPMLEMERKKILNNNAATYFPSGELVWVPSQNFTGEMNASYFKLAWCFDLYTASLKGKTIFSSAAILLFASIR